MARLSRTSHRGTTSSQEGNSKSDGNTLEFKRIQESDKDSIISTEKSSEDESLDGAESLTPQCKLTPKPKADLKTTKSKENRGPSTARPQLEPDRIWNFPQGFTVDIDGKAQPVFKAGESVNVCVYDNTHWTVGQPMKDELAPINDNELDEPDILKTGKVPDKLIPELGLLNHPGILTMTTVLLAAGHVGKGALISHLSRSEALDKTSKAYRDRQRHSKIFIGGDPRARVNEYTGQTFSLMPPCFQTATLTPQANTFRTCTRGKSPAIYCPDGKLRILILHRAAAMVNSAEMRIAPFHNDLIERALQRNKLQPDFAILDLPFEVGDSRLQIMWNLAPKSFNHETFARKLPRLQANATWGVSGERIADEAATGGCQSEWEESGIPFDSSTSQSRNPASGASETRSIIDFNHTHHSESQNRLNNQSREPTEPSSLDQDRETPGHCHSLTGIMARKDKLDSVTLDQSCRMPQKEHEANENPNDESDLRAQLEHARKDATRSKEALSELYLEKRASDMEILAVRKQLKAAQAELHSKAMSGVEDRLKVAEKQHEDEKSRADNAEKEFVQYKEKAEVELTKLRSKLARFRQLFLNADEDTDEGDTQIGVQDSAEDSRARKRRKLDG